MSGIRTASAESPNIWIPMAALDRVFVYKIILRPFERALAPPEG